jgi:outer membrane protein TolC
MFSKASISGVVVLGALPLAAAAEPLRADEPALAGYVRRAAEHYPELAARAVEIDERRADRAAVRAGYLPSVDLDVRYTRTFGNQIDLGKLINPAYVALNQLLGAEQFPTDVEAELPLRLDARVRVTQPVFAPALYAGDHLAAAGVAAGVAERGVASRDVAAGVRVAYLQHARAAMVVDLLRRSRPLFEEAVRVSELLATADKTTGDTLPRAKAELAGFDQQVREVERARAAAARQLNLLIDAPIDGEVAVPAELAVPAALAGTADDLVATARTRRGELRVIDAGDAAGKAERELARSAYLPTVAVALDYGVQSNDIPDTDDDYVAISVVAQWNLFAGGRDRAKVRAAELARAQLAIRKDQLADRVELEVRQAWADAETAHAAIASADERITSAQAAYDVVARRYEAGAVAQIELIAARTALLGAQTDRIVAVTDLHLRLVELDRVAETHQESP